MRGRSRARANRTFGQEIATIARDRDRAIVGFLMIHMGQLI